MVEAGNSSLGSALLGTAPLTTAMHITCWSLGAFSLVVNIGMHKIPIEKFRFAEKIDLESGKQNGLIDKYYQRADDNFKKYNDQLSHTNDE